METEERKPDRRRRRWLSAAAGVLLVVAVLGGAYFKEGRAWWYGLQAYVYGFPLVMMDLTKDQGTAVPVAGEIAAPLNQFAIMTRYPDASFRAVVRTGLDTLFATAWVDLDNEPLVLSVPDTGGRYYVIALFDMWSNVFTSIGRRNTGTGAASFLQASSPGADREANWLPSPASGPFNITVRIYWPKQEVRDGSYKLPPLKQMQ